MRDRRSGLVLLSILATVLFLDSGSARAALLVPEDRGPGGQALYAWDPGKSVQGGEQEDTRIDQPVACWRAQISLPDLFASIAEQTGVSIGFWPPDDQNARLRVNVFLNADDPPALGDLMAQLSWVTDCAFGFTGSGDSTRYYLLSTSIAQSAAAGLQQREAEAGKRCADLLQALKDATSELGHALQLPRQDATGLYRGRDDALLLNLLDPVGRPAAQLVSRHVTALLDIIQFDPNLAPDQTQGFGTAIYVAPLPADEKEAVATAFPGWEADYDDPGVACFLFVSSDGQVRLGPPHSANESYEDWGKGILPVMDLSHDIHSRPEDEIALRRLLGDTISGSEEESYVARRKQEIAADERQAEAQRRAAGRYLSDEMSGVLARCGIALPAGVYPAWRIEEAVARTTGCHIVADALLGATAEMPPSRTGMGELNALRALEAFCNAPGRNFMRSPEWDWGDAGPFLTFRTSNRDVWRAAMLPEALLEWLGAQVAPHLPESGEQTQRPAAVEFELPVEPEQWTRWLSSLSQLQIKYGGIVPCGEPSDLLDAAGRSAWKAAFALAEFHPAMLRFLGSLSPAQWQLTRAGTLRGPGDLTPDQMEAIRAAADEKTAWTTRLPEDSWLVISVTRGPCEADELRRYVTYGQAGEQTAGAAGGGRAYPEEIAGAGEWYRVNLAAKGLLPGEEKETTVLEKQVPFLPVSIHVRAGAGN